MRGQGLVEYALALVLVAILIITLLMILGSCGQNEMEKQGYNNADELTTYYFNEITYKGMPCLYTVDTNVYWANYKTGGITCDWSKLNEKELSSWGKDGR